MAFKALHVAGPVELPWQRISNRLGQPCMISHTMLPGSVDPLAKMNVTARQSPYSSFEVVPTCLLSKAETVPVGSARALAAKHRTRDRSFMASMVERTTG